MWALGDCNGRGAFTHTAYNDFEIIAANLLDNDHRRVGDRLSAYALYIDPPLGRVGLTEREARATGRPLLVGRRPMTRIGRAVEKGETQGFIKILVDAQSKQIVGAAILGTGGDEAIHGVLDVMTAGAPATTLRRSMPIHPTVSELIPTVLGDLVAGVWVRMGAAPLGTRRAGRRSVKRARAIPLLRRQLAIVRTLLDDVERAAPAPETTGLDFTRREQLIEELARLGQRILECADAMTAEDRPAGPETVPVGQPLADPEAALSLRMGRPRV